TRRRLGREARPARRALPGGRASLARRGGRRRDRSRRRAHRGLPRRRARGRPRRRRPLRRQDGGDALVTDLLAIHPEVREALERRLAVVALETTLVSHGFPAGEGAEVGRESERRVRAAGAVPATIGILD